MARLTHRLAAHGDMPAIRAVMARAIDVLQRGFLTTDQIAASRTVMGSDTQLIDDASYFLVESAGALAGCGGWSARDAVRRRP